MIVITAILCGMETWEEMADWAETRLDWFHTFLELPNGIPSHDTLNRVFQMMDPERFHAAFFRWTEGLFDSPDGIISIDGKTLRRSREASSGQRPAHVVSAWASEAALVLGQMKVDEKTNEIRAIPELLDVLDLKGCIVTIDAMGTQKEIAGKIIGKEADYILQVKGNQQALMQDIVLRFEEDIFPQEKDRGVITRANPYLHPYSSCDTLFADEAMVLACFSFRKISEKSVEISSWFCYNLIVSLCSRAGVKNPRWQADT